MRFTSNGLRGNDSYPANQAPKVLLTGPDGKPYADLSEAMADDDR